MGADICGFNGNTTGELCARWQALGAFYPFSRNHNSIESTDQDPAFLGTTVVKATINALTTRYALLPYLYTLFYYATARGDTVMRSLAFEFPTDAKALAVEEQFLWGSSVLITPVLREKATSVDAYFPAGKWYDYKTGNLIINSTGITKKLDMPIDEIGVAIRGGSILPTQSPKKTTEAQKGEPFILVAALDGNGAASGTLYWDDGDSMSAMLLENYSLVNFDVKDVSNFTFSHTRCKSLVFLRQLSPRMQP